MTRFSDRPRQIAAAIAVVLLTSCGGGADEPAGPDTTVATVSISAPTMTIAPGGSVQLSATAKNAAGNSLANAAFSWTSSVQSVATVSSTGLVTAVANGITVITATSGGKPATISITVQTIAQDNTVATVTVTAAAASVAPGSTVQLTATPRNAAGSVLTGFTATWSTSNAAVATVDGNGLVTGVANGTATITATISGKTGDRDVTVQPPAATFVDATTGNAFNPQQVDVTVGSTVGWRFATTHNVTFAATAGAPSNITDTGSGTVSRTFNTAGTFNYQCTIHLGMTGTVVVH